MRSRRGSQRGGDSVGGSAAAARPAELVLPGQPDLERLQADPGPRLQRPGDPADRQEVEGRADPGRLSRPAVHGHAGRRAATSSATRRRAAHSIPREQVPQFYADFLNKPTALNNFQTMNRYWMEDSFGRYGVELVPFGPYRMPLKSYQYHIQQLPERGRGLPEPDARDPEPGAVRPGLLQRRAQRLGRRRVPRRRARDLRQPVLDLRGPGRVGRVAGVRRDALHRPERGHRRVRPEAHRPAAPARQLGLDALHPVDLVGRGRQRVAERVGQQLDRGRVRRHGRVRARALAQPRASRTTTTTRSRPRTSGPRAACGT